MLFTKLHIPSPTKSFVFRKQIYDKLNERNNKKVILISAPAGYGKTTILVDWVNRNKIPTAWYSLDENDNNLQVFLDYIIAGLQTIDESIGIEIQQALKSNIDIPVESITELLIDDIIKYGKEIVLALDDFHVIHNDGIIQFIRYFLDYKPENIVLSFITRSDPPIQVSKLRSRQQIVEIRSEDLKFSDRDIEEFFKKAHDITLSKGEIGSLLAKTEGWISGLHLAGISMKSHESASTFIENLKGSNRYIMDYLMDEVLSSMDGNLREFLLKTSILDRMCPPLCDYILKSQNSIAELSALERNNLFIVPLDDKREWYRYHHLFSDLLKKRLIQSTSFDISELHSLASNWLVKNKLFDEAIGHLLHARNYQKAAELISQQMVNIWDDGNHYKYSPWLKSLPEDILNQIPQLIILEAELNMARWHIPDAERLLKDAENLLNSVEKQDLTPIIPLSESSTQNLRGRILVNHALIASYHENTSDIVKYVEKALETLSKDEVIWRNLASMVLSDACFILGNLHDAHRIQTEITKSYQIAQNPFLSLMSGANLAVTLRQQGKLKESLKLCDDITASARNYGLYNTTVIGWTQTIKGEILAELNQLNEAEKIALQGVEKTIKLKIPGVLLKCYLLLIRIYFSEKKYSEIFHILQRIKDQTNNSGITRHLKNQIEAWRIRVLLSQEQFEPVEQWLQEYETQKDDIFLYINEVRHLVVCRACLALGKLKDAEKLLGQLKIEAEKYGRMNTLIEIFLIKAKIRHQLKDMECAMEYFLEALALAETNGYVRIILDEGEEIESLLKEIQHTKKLKSSEKLDAVSSEYIDALVRAFDKERRTASILVEETLSTRELDTLKLIAEELTNQEIANELYISITTVKTHVRNILLKMEAKNRSQAVSKAREKQII